MNILHKNKWAMYFIIEEQERKKISIEFQNYTFHILKSLSESDIKLLFWI